ncbi:MAG: response regulator, partial [Bacteroidales bacterium]|nr:response regulator [Bacteroidales bacterium]
MKTLYENTILVVDDTPENIEILVELLDGFDLKVAINGQEALETAWEGQAPDLILLDIMMPEMDGYEACRQLRADERTREVPVIFLTAKTQKEDIYKAFEAGGQDYVTKPFDARELMERVKTQLELKTQREVLKDMNLLLEEKVRERTEQLDKANKELMVLDEAKNSFLMMISHEIRTPLNGIVGATYFLNDSLAEDNDLAEFVDMLKTSVDRLEKFSTTALIITQLSTNQT